MKNILDVNVLKKSSQLPNVLVVTDNSISLKHGTGICLIKHFDAYSEHKLLNLYSLYEGKPAFNQHCRIRPKLIPGLAMKLMALGRGDKAKEWQNRLEEFALQRNLRGRIEKLGFTTDIIYAVCFGYRGLLLLKKIAKEYGEKVPIILHFFDYQPKDSEAVPALLRSLSPAISEVWALTSTMVEEISQQMNRSVDLVRIFHIDLPHIYKEVHRPLTADFQAVMIGNCWIPEMLTDIRRAWQYAKNKIGDLKPIQWYAHPSTIDKIRHSNIQFKPEIEYAGFVPDNQFFQVLRQSDMGIIPFNRKDIPENDYARFSLPSRITEMASIGLPIFCAAGPHTELERYVRENGIGCCSLSSDMPQFQQDLLSFMENQQLRKECGRQARHLATQKFNLNNYQEWFYQKLVQVSKKI